MNKALATCVNGSCTFFDVPENASNLEVMKLACDAIETWGEDVKKPSNGYYLMAGQQISDGPFTELEGAVDQLLALCPKGWAPPERLTMFVACFNGEVLDLVKDENGEVINGNLAQHREMDYWADLSKRRPTYPAKAENTLKECLTCNRHSFHQEVDRGWLCLTCKDIKCPCTCHSCDGMCDTEGGDCCSDAGKK